MYTTETNEFIVETVLYDLKDNKPMGGAEQHQHDQPGDFRQDIAARSPKV
jgi:hypothetical protein